MANDSELITFEDLEKTDVISVELVPERKGLILKHCEYYVSSRRYGTTVTRRYNEFAQLYDVLFAKYPYRALSRLPPKRVVVNGGSPRFLQRRRAALQRWLTLVARHPVLAHDSDLRAFLCESNPKFERPKHDEFMLAGTQEANPVEMLTEEMQAAFIAEQDQLRLVQLGLERLFQIFDKVEGRVEAERADLRELGAGLHALSAPAHTDTAQWTPVREAMRGAAELASKIPVTEPSDTSEDTPVSNFLLAVEALEAMRGLCARLSRGLHAERVNVAVHTPTAGVAAGALRGRHRYALKCQLEEARVSRAYALAALQSVPELFRARAASHAHVAGLWAQLYDALRLNT